MKTRLKEEDPVVFAKDKLEGAGYIRGIEECYSGILYLIEILFYFYLYIKIKYYICIDFN